MRRYSFSTRARSGSRNWLSSAVSSLPSARRERASAPLILEVLKAGDAADAPTRFVDLDYDRAIDALIAGEIDVAIFPSSSTPAYCDARSLRPTCG